MSKLSENRDAERSEELRQKSLDQQIPTAWQIAAGVGGVVISLAANFVFSSAGMAMVCWLLTALCCGMLLTHLPRVRYWVGTKRRVLILGSAAIVFAPGFFFLNDQRHKQHAALMEGELEATHAGYTEVGKNLWWRPFGTKDSIYGTENSVGGEDGSWHFVGNNPTDWLKVYRKDGKVFLSTTVRDRFGNLIVKIENNKWEVGPKSTVWDKNYTDDTLEVVDARGRVVLQVRLLENGVMIDGEWPSSGDQKPFVISDKPRYSPEKGFKRLFKYPSSQHWGEYEDDECPTCSETEPQYATQNIH